MKGEKTHRAYLLTNNLNNEVIYIIQRQNFTYEF